MWKVVETETGEARMAEAEGRRGQGESRKEARRARKEEVKEEEGSRSKMSDGRVGNLGGGRGSSKVKKGGKETSFRKVLLVDKSVWQKTIRENTHMKDLRLCHQYEKRIHAKKEEDIPIV